MADKITTIDVSAYRVPTASPESDGTYQWNATTLVLVQIEGAGARGIGFTYAGTSAAELIRGHLRPLVLGQDPMDIPQIWQSMVQSVRNMGRQGIASAAISAVDMALWDLKAKMLNLPTVRLLGQVRPSIAAYGSGGFTSYSHAQLQRQFEGWAGQGFKAVKMKVGREPQKDIQRVRQARKAIGKNVELFVDANGAHTPKDAVKQADLFAQEGVTWFEEPVSSDDLDGLNFVRNHGPAGMRIAAGEYGYDPYYFRRMLSAGAVDVLQVDATRCGGVTGFMQAAALSDAFHMPLSAHTAPSLHQHLCCSASRAINVEYFLDHYRIEQMFFTGAAQPVRGQLRPDLGLPGFGLEFIPAKARKYRI